MSKTGSAMIDKMNEGKSWEPLKPPVRYLTEFMAAFKLGQIVYLSTDKEQSERIVTSYQVDSRGVLYQLSQGATASWHFDIEITAEKDLIKSLL